MRDFIRRALQLPYDAYFCPSVLQERLNAAAPQIKGNTPFLQLSRDILTVVGARRFFLQCLLVWFLGLLPFWGLAWGAIPWPGRIVVSAGLLLAAWGISLVDLPLGLAFPLLAGLVWGLRPELWTATLAGAAPWLDGRYLGLLAVDLVLGASLGAGGVAWAFHTGPRRLAPRLAGAAGIVSGLWAIGVALDVAGFGPGILAVAVAVGVVVFVAGFGAGSVARYVAGTVAGAVAGGVALVVAGFVAGVVAGVVAGTVAGSVGVVLAGAVAGIVAGVVAVFVAVGVAVLVAGVAASIEWSATTDWASIVVAGGIAVVIAVVVAGIVAVVVAGAVAGGATLRPVLVGGLALGLGFVLSPRRTPWIGLSVAALNAAMCIEPQGWAVAGFVLLAFLLGLSRLPLYPVALALSARAAVLARMNTTGANARVRRLPPFNDQCQRLRVYGLDRALSAALDEDHQQGSWALDTVAASPYQSWAARAVCLQWSAQTMAEYRTVDEIRYSFQELAWLPEEPGRSLVDVGEVRSRVVAIAQQIDAALSATSDYNRLRRLHQAQSAVSDLRRFFSAATGRAVRLFVPVAERWSRLIDDEIALLTESQAIRTDIPNPYVPGIPVQPYESAMFAPRPDLVRALENALMAAHGKPTLALYGPRRMGKTSFLLHLPRLLPDRVVPVFVDLQEATQVSGPGGLYYNWADAACRAAREFRQLALPRPDLEAFRGEPAITWREWLDGAEGLLGERTLFFTFDEFERLVDRAERDRAWEGAFSVLRHLIQHRPRVYLLFAGAHRLEELAPSGRWHDYFINVRPLEVSYLDEDQARRLLTSPIPDFPVEYGRDVVDEIVRLTRCQPTLVQLTGSLLVDWLNSPERRLEGDWLLATMQDVEHVAGEILRVGRPYFANLWSDAGETGRQVLRIIADSKEGCPRETLRAQSGLRAGELPNTLQWLVQYQLIEHVGRHWRVQVELTRRAFVRLAKNGHG